MTDVTRVVVQTVLKATGFLKIISRECGKITG